MIDKGDILTIPEFQQLSKKLTEFELQTTHQIVVLTIAELRDETIEGYAYKTFEAGKLGQEGKDNGLLILVSKKDKKVRFEVGYGLEPYITDAISSRMIRETMIPHFKDNRYYLGLNNAIDTIINILGQPEVSEELAAKPAYRLDFKTVFLHSIFALFLIGFSGIVGFLFYSMYTHYFIDVFRGLFTGKISLIYFPFIFVKTAFPTLFSLIGALGILLSIPFVVFNADLEIFFNLWNNLTWVFAAFALFLAITILLAIRKINSKGEQYGFSWFVTDAAFKSKTLSSSGVSSGTTNSYSSSSSSSYSGSSGRSSSSSRSSFSGGGGRSGGGGASGSW